jgi:hypothetical protein
MSGDKGPSTLKNLIDPEHLLQAIANSLDHTDETAHGITGLHFKNYMIIVHKRKGLSWYIECKFKRGERDTRSSLT